MTRNPFRIPRRPAARPYSEPIERDDDGLIDVGAVRDTEFVTKLLAETVAADIDDDDDYPAYFDDSGPVPVSQHDISAPVRLHTKKA